VGTAAPLNIRQVGAGYDSLIALTSPDTYTGSLCFSPCTAIQEIGDTVTLAHLTPKYTTQYGHVTSVTVALVNFGAAKTLTVTLRLYNSPNVVTYTFHKSATIAGGSATHQVVTNVTFTLAATSVFVKQTFQYGVSLTSNDAGVNIALAHHASELTIGGSPPQTVWVAKVSSGAVGPFSATTKTWSTGFIPAVQINVVNGVVPPLYPGAPAQSVQYAITNPNPGRMHVGTITTSIKTNGTTLLGATGCAKTWFTLNHNPFDYNTTVAPGTTIVSTGPTTIQMTTVAVSQNACVGTSVSLAFSSN
jgi:hypothetical protein